MVQESLIGFDYSQAVSFVTKKSEAVPGVSSFNTTGYLLPAFYDSEGFLLKTENANLYGYPALFWKKLLPDPDRKKERKIGISLYENLIYILIKQIKYAYFRHRRIVTHRDKYRLIINRINLAYIKI